MSDERIFLGLYSGAAADGIDAVAVAIEGEGEVMHVTQMEHVEKYYPEGERRRILKSSGGRIDSCSLLAELDRDIAIAAAATGRILMGKSEITSEVIEAIGWSGHEIAFESPGSTNQLGCGLRLGSPEIIADRLGCPVVSGFADSDFAVGGCGGLLGAWCDWLMFRDRQFSRVIVDLGGVATMTFLPMAANIVDVISYDVAPGTLVLDELVHRFHNKNCDFDGAIAGGGRVNPVLLNELLANGYFLEEPPKRLNLADWSETYHWRLLQLSEKHRVDGANLISTVAEMTARAIADSVTNLSEIPHEIILTGGGSLNIHLAGRIRRLLVPAKTYTIEKYGFNIRAKKATCMAVLAAARMDGFTAHSPHITGAEKKAILGRVSLP